MTNQKAFFWLRLATVLCGIQFHAFSQSQKAVAIPDATTSKASTVDRDLTAAQTFFDLGRFGLAFDRYEQVLAADEGNVPAQQGEERLCEELQRRDYGEWWRHLFRRTREGAALWQKLHAIVLPEVDFAGTPLAGAVDFLRGSVLQLDPNPDPTKRKEASVKIYLDFEVPRPAARLTGTAAADPPIPGLPAEETASAQTAPFDAATTRMTLHIKQISLYDALTYVASQAGLRVVLRRDGVHLIRQTNGYDHYPTETFDLTLEATGLLPSENAQKKAFVDAVVVHHQDPRPWLEKIGVTFQFGAAVNYQAEKRTLVLRNSRENQELVGMFLDAHE